MCQAGVDRTGVKGSARNGLAMARRGHDTQCHQLFPRPAWGGPTFRVKRCGGDTGRPRPRPPSMATPRTMFDGRRTLCARDTRRGCALGPPPTVFTGVIPPQPGGPGLARRLPHAGPDATDNFLLAGMRMRFLPLCGLDVGAPLKGMAAPPFTPTAVSH